jgi:hypothetical protein
MQDGFTWHGVTIANPFASCLPAPLAALLARPQAVVGKRG